MVHHATFSMLKGYVSPVLDAIGLFDRRLTNLLDHPDRLLVVMYHRVIEDPALDPFALGMCVSRENFIEQLEWFRTALRPIALAEAVSLLAAGKSLPPRSVAITFDDGYSDNLQVAAPLLAERGMHATFYVPTGGLCEGRALWWDRAIRALADTRLVSLTLPALWIDQPLSLEGSRRARTARTVLDALWRVPPTELQMRLEDLVATLTPQAQSDLASDNRAPRMTTEQVAKLHAMGFHIGGHTVSHVDLRQLDNDSIVREFTDSRRTLTEICDAEIDSFAYPSGFHTETVQVHVRAAGFHHAVSTDRGINAQPVPRFALRRVGMTNLGLADFKRALSTAPVGTESGTLQSV